MINFVKSGDNLTLVAPYDVLSGGGFKVGNLFGVAANDALSGANVECEVEGVYDLAKDASTFAQGDLAYWDDTANNKGIGQMTICGRLSKRTTNVDFGDLCSTRVGFLRTNAAKSNC